MKLLNTYEDKEEAGLAEQKITGLKRLASERDGTQTIYNLFGEANWGNFYKLEMFNLPLLKELLNKKQSGDQYDSKKHQEIVTLLKHASKSFQLEIPKHWL